MAQRITFECSGCAEFFEEPVQTFIDAPGETVAAPALCESCGHDWEDDN